LIFRERYYSDIQVATHFQLCAESTDVGLLIHEMPFVNGRGGAPMNWPIGLLDRLADIPNVVAIKEDCKEDAYSREVIETVRDRLNIIISGGGKRQWLRFADLGCQAWLNGIGVFEPKLATLFWRSYLAGDDTTMQKIITDIEEPFFEHAVGPFGWHLAIKSALECRGLMSRRERMPMMALDDVSHGQVERLMSKLPIDGLGL
jgi:dihydrodipicolinate synthase/N-acetylneuraminate lyase